MTVIRSEGALTLVHRAWSPALQPRAVSLYGNVVATYQALYRAQPNVRTCVDFLARNFAQLNLKAYSRVSQTDRVELFDHPFGRTLRRPNPRTSRFRMMRDTYSDQLVYGNALWVKIKHDKSPQVGLLRVPWWMVTPVGKSWLWPEGYEIAGNSGVKELAPDEVVHFRFYNPEEGTVGVPPLETLRRTLAEEAAAGEYRENFWRNAARMEGVIKRPAESGRLSDKAFERLRDSWRSMYSGAASSGETAILEEGMEFQKTSFSAKDAEYLAARKLTREECASGFHIPPPMIGILDHATFSNIKEQHVMLYQDTLGPTFVEYEEDIDLQLMPEFADLDPDKTYVEFNIAEKLKGSFEEQASALQTMVGRPIMTANEGRARLNLPAIDGDAGQLVTPLNVLIGGQASPRDSAPKALPPAAAKADSLLGAVRRRERHVAKHEQILRGFFARQSAVVLSAYGAKADVTIDWTRWETELHTDLLAVAQFTAEEFGRETFEQFAGKAAGAHGKAADEFDPDPMFAYLTENARIAAEEINAATRDEIGIAAASDDPAAALKDLFARAAGVRAGMIAASRVTLLANFGRTNGARSAGAAAKVWRVTSENPRASHSRINGEQVEIGGVFSIGGQWPGDPKMGAAEVANCSCVVEFA